ncbi:MAG: PadR family transcriptional regulator [Streptomyces sp.]|nr:PadR family transcriptional regulator [Streptomyces sp.]NUS24435.1 PadR family transcriptional regulator [Streptomyces sp.]
MTPRLTTTVRLVLDALHNTPAPAHGLGIAHHTGLGHGTVYPILHRLEAAGWLHSEPEQGDVCGRPPRRLYTLTDQAPRP